MKSVKFSELMIEEDNLSLAKRFNEAYSKTEKGIARKKVIVNCSKYACIGLGVITVMCFARGIQANATVEGIESLKATNPTLWSKFTKCVLESGRAADNYTDARILLDYNLSRTATYKEIETIKQACEGMTDIQVLEKIFADMIQSFRNVIGG